MSTIFLLGSFSGSYLRVKKKFNPTKIIIPVFKKLGRAPVQNTQTLLPGGLGTQGDESLSRRALSL